MLGTYALSAGFYDAFYLKGPPKVRTLIRRDFDPAFAKCDVIAGPTAPRRRSGSVNGRPAGDVPE